MANSVNIYTVDATTAVTKQFAINFTLGYLSQSHVEAFVVGELDGAGDQIFRTVTFINDALVELSGTLNVGDVVHVQRTTPSTSLIHDFQAGAVLKEANIDDANLQALMLLHEIYDGRQINEFSQDLNMNLNDILNVGTVNAEAMVLGGQSVIPVGGLSATQVESKILADGQVAVVFTASLAFEALYITGDLADSGRLVSGVDYTTDLVTNTVTLSQSYPAGTTLTLVYNDSGVAKRTATTITAALTDITAEINVANKTAGATVFNTDTNKPLWSTGNAAADVWVDATGATAHTPV